MGKPLVAWEPRGGGLIVLAVNGNALFFERSGLHHLRSDFELGGRNIHALAWSYNSRWLAVAGQWEENYEVRLFARRNYKWYLGKKIRVGAKVAAVAWGEDDVAEMAIYLVDGHVVVVNILPCVDVLRLRNGSVACVADGDKLLLTDLGSAILPPPLSHGAWSFGAGIEAVCDNVSDGEVGVLLDDGSFATRKLRDDEFTVARMEEGGNGQVAEGQRWILEGENEDGPMLSKRCPVLLKGGLLLLVDHAAAWKVESEHEELIKVFHLRTDTDRGTCIASHAVAGRVTAIAPSTIDNAVIMTTSKGVLTRFVVDPDHGEVSEVSSIVAAVPKDVVLISDHVVENGKTLTLALDKKGVLKIVDVSTGRILLISTECTSYCVHGRFLSFTTLSELYCMFMGSALWKSYVGDRGSVPYLLDALHGKDNAVEKAPHGLRLVAGRGATRPIDRESLLVTGQPNGVDIVLQAPRGNLETICPRPAVFEAVDLLAKRADYSNAFQLCRRQRLNGNHIVDADYDLFIGNIAKFVVEVGNEDSLSEFMTRLAGNETKINAVCDEIVRVLRQIEGRERYTKAILTGLIHREPLDLNEALIEVDFVRTYSVRAGESALDHLFILVRQESKVYEEALGRYDLELALFVATNSQMDPADYASELKNFSEMEEKMRKYSIDMRLERYEKALRHLHSVGAEKTEECMALCLKHALYETALELFHNNDVITFRLLHAFGKYLSSEGKHKEAASVFMRVRDLTLAGESYRKAGLWRLCATAICRKGISWSRKRMELESLANELYERRMFVECSEIRMNHLGDVEGAVESIACAGEWERLFEMVAGYLGQCKRGLVQAERISTATLWSEVDGFVLDGAVALERTIVEIKEQMREWRVRLELVRERKREMNERLAAKEERADEEDSDRFTATTGSSVASSSSDVSFHHRSSATSLYSSAASQVGPLSEGKLRKQEEKRNRKAARKRVKQGSPREEEHLMELLRRIVPGRDLKNKVGALLRALMFVGNVDSASKLKREMLGLIEQVKLIPIDVIGGATVAELEDLRWAEGATYVDVMPNSAS